MFNRYFLRSKLESYTLSKLNSTAEFSAKIACEIAIWSGVNYREIWSAICMLDTEFLAKVITFVPTSRLWSVINNTPIISHKNNKVEKNYYFWEWYRYIQPKFRKFARPEYDKSNF